MTYASGSAPHCVDPENATSCTCEEGFALDDTDEFCVEVATEEFAMELIVALVLIVNSLFAASFLCFCWARSKKSRDPPLLSKQQPTMMGPGGQMMFPQSTMLGPGGQMMFPESTMLGPNGPMMCPQSGMASGSPMPYPQAPTGSPVPPQESVSNNEESERSQTERAGHRAGHRAHSSMFGRPRSRSVAYLVSSMPASTMKHLTSSVSSRNSASVRRESVVWPELALKPKSVSPRKKPKMPCSSWGSPRKFQSEFDAPSSMTATRQSQGEANH